MAILGIGVDIVELQRIGRLYGKHGETFVNRFCNPGECQERQGQAMIEHLGGLFSAKEAVMKALGTGWAQGLGFRQIEVVRNAAGAPSVELHGKAAEQSSALGVRSIHLTISHEQKYAVAMAVLEGNIADKESSK